MVSEIVTIAHNPELSVIVAVYNEDPRNLLLLLDRLADNLNPQGIQYEVVFVNDGSRQPTSEALRKIAMEFERVKLVELSRNFGQQAAITAGLDHAAGDVIVNMDSDLQDPPELIPAMMEKWREGFDVVYARRSKRRDRLAKRVTAHVFYRVLGAISTIEIPWDTGDFRLMDRKVVDALARMPEKTRFIRGMVPWLGFRQCGIPLDRDARELGESTYTVRKLLSLALDGLLDDGHDLLVVVLHGLLAFSVAPLLFLPVIGLGLGAVGFLVTIAALLTGGWTLTLGSLSGVIMLATGAQVFAVGVVAVYISRVLEEVRARPTYLVGQRLGTGFISKMDPVKAERLQRAAQYQRDESTVSVR